MKRLLSTVLSLILIFIPLLVSAKQQVANGIGSNNSLPAIQDETFLNHLKNAKDDSMESVIVFLKKQENWAKELQKWSKQDANKKVTTLQSVISKSEKAQNSFLATYSILKGEKYWLGNALFLRTTAKKIKEMATDPRVDKIIENKMVQLPILEKNLKSVKTENVTYAWGVDKINAHRAWHGLGTTGKDIKVAVIDTGIQADHPDLDGRVVAWADFINGQQKNAYDDEGHGTHVAGSIAGNGADGIITGVAPDVLLMGAKVLDHEGKGTNQTVLSGLQWAAENDADIINLSLSGAQTDAYNAIFVDLHSLGIIPVVAAGNSGPEPSTIGSPGSHPLALTIGATDLDDLVAPFSSRGPVQTETGEILIKPDIVAPGVDIISTWKDGGYAVGSGTSMAAPHTAGAVALIKEAFPNASFNDIKSLLTVNSVGLGKSQPNSESGWGRIDVYQTILSGMQNGTLTGSVVDAQTLEPIQDAKILIAEKNMTVSTDPFGQFSISLPAGTYTIKAQSFLYDSKEFVVTINDQESQNIAVQLHPQPAGSATGVVVDVRNQPIPSVKINLETLGQTLVTYTERDGTFIFDRLPEGDWKISAESYRIAPVETRVTVRANQDSPVQLVTYRTIAAESMVGYYRSNHLPVDTSEDGSLVITGTTADVNEDSEPNLFALTDSGNHLWTAKLGDRVNGLAVANNGSLIAAAHIGASFGTLEDMQKGEPEEDLPPAPWSAPRKVIKGDGISILNREGNIMSTVPAADLSGTFAISNANDLILYADKFLYVWDKNGALVSKTPLEAPAYGLAISGDGKSAAIALMDGRLALYDIEGTHVALKKTVVVTETGWPWSVSINDDGSLIVVGEYTEDKNQVGHIRAFSKDGVLKWTVETGWHVDKTDMSANGNVIAAGSWDGKLYVMNGLTGALLYTQTPGRPDNTMIDAKVKVKVSPNGERVAASFVRANLVNVYDVEGVELASQFSWIHPVGLTGFENLNRLVVTGPTILADGLTGPAEIAYLDTPDGAYVDINRSIKEKDLAPKGTLRYGDYGTNYYLDVDYLRRTFKTRWISQSPSGNDLLPQTSFKPYISMNNGFTKLYFMETGIQLNLDGNLEYTFESILTPWSLLIYFSQKNERSIWPVDPIDHKKNPITPSPLPEAKYSQNNKSSTTATFDPNSNQNNQKYGTFRIKRY
jgi:subtilisin family serine protease/WD40 repeat protein